MKNLFYIIITIITFQSCNNIKTPELVYSSIFGFTQGTNFNITYAFKDSVDLQTEIEYLLAEFDTSLSTYNPASVISKVNRNEEVELDEYFLKLFDRAIEISVATDGAFDMTAAPVINAWGFGPERKSEISGDLIDSLLEFIGYQKVRVIGGKVIKEDPRIQLNANAIAQGYSVDVIAEYLENKGCENYLVEIGGEVRTKGLNNKGKIWRIGIDKPIDNNLTPGANLQAIISLSNLSMATSGNYRKFYEKDGVKYSHTIDPLTGYPVTHSLLSATIITKECMTADALATAFMVMGIEKAKEFLHNNPKIKAYLIYSDEKGRFNVYYTPSLEKMIDKV